MLVVFIQFCSSYFKLFSFLLLRLKSFYIPYSSLLICHLCFTNNLFFNYLPLFRNIWKSKIPNFIEVQFINFLFYIRFNAWFMKDSFTEIYYFYFKIYFEVYSKLVFIYHVLLGSIFIFILFYIVKPEKEQQESKRNS